MHIHPRRYLAVSLMLAMATSARGADGPATTAPASGPAPKLHCVVLNEASGAAPNTEIVVHTIGAAGWMPASGETTGKGGACDLAFPGNAPGLLMLKVRAPGYKEAEVYYLPDPGQVIPWLTITLKGALQLTGTVVNGDDQPVADAEVVLDMPAGPRKTKTDAQGRFVLEELMPIRTTVRVEVPGVGCATYRVDLTRKTEPLKIMLRPQRRVSLRVVDTDKKPVPDLALEVLSPRKFEGKTDADGRIRVPGIGANAAQIRVSLADKFYCFDEPEMRLDVDEGSQPVELELYATYGGRICGQVVEMIEGGEVQGIPAATVWLVEGGRVGKSAECDEDGKFELDGVPADSYVIAAGHLTYATSLGRAEVTAGKESKVNFTLGSGATIHGTVVDPQGKPAERAIVRVAAWYPKPQGRGKAEPVELPMRATRTDAEGGYVLEFLPAGRIVIEAAAEDGSHWTTANVQVPEGKGVTEVKISLKDNRDKPPL